MDHSDNEPWLEMTDDEYRESWSRFSERVQFTADPATGWQKMVQPEGAVTFDLSAVFAATYPNFVAAARAVDAEVLKALVSLTPPDGRLMMLDWHHPAYWFLPHKITSMQLDPALPAFPDGDYFADMTEDSRQGAYGHPFEQTLCIVGADLGRTLVPILSPWLPLQNVPGT